MKRIAIECSHAASLAAKLADVDVIAAYPITPQTHIVEKLSDYVAEGELDAEYINVESEHSAMSACVGAAAMGARVYTSTAGQGLALMHEILFIASGLRLPIVMSIANRSLSPNLSIWGDQSDVMASRDCGWIMFFAENAQEIFDLTLQAFKIAEDERVQLPVAINFDGFQVSHITEPLLALDEEEVRRFLLPKKGLKYALDPDHPTTWGPIGIPDIQFEVKRQHEGAIQGSKAVIAEVAREFGNMFGRFYSALEPYRLDDAEVAILMMGGFCGTARVAVDKAREAGMRVGLLKQRLFRPFPAQELREALKDVGVVAVVDKAFSTGGLGGPLFNEVRTALYEAERRPHVGGFVTGIGGRDVTLDHFATIVDRAYSIKAKGKVEKEIEFVGVRE